MYAIERLLCATFLRASHISYWFRVVCSSRYTTHSYSIMSQHHQRASHLRGGRTASAAGTASQTRARATRAASMMDDPGSDDDTELQHLAGSAAHQLPPQFTEPIQQSDRSETRALLSELTQGGGASSSSPENPLFSGTAAQAAAAIMANTSSQLSSQTAELAALAASAGGAAGGSEQQQEHKSPISAPASSTAPAQQIPPLNLGTVPSFVPSTPAISRGTASLPFATPALFQVNPASSPSSILYGDAGLTAGSMQANRFAPFFSQHQE